MLLKSCIMQIFFIFLSPVNAYIDVKQKFCSEIRVLHIRIKGYGSPEGILFAKNATPGLERGFSRNCNFFLPAAGRPALNLIFCFFKNFSTNS
jgi:hypothetical protein